MRPSSPLNFPPRRRRHFLFAQLATDAALRPQPVTKHLPAPWTSPLRQPPPRRQIHANPNQQNPKIRRLAQLHLRNGEAQKNKTEKQHDYQIPSRHIAVPRAPIDVHILRAGVAHPLIGFSASVQARSELDGPSVSPIPLWGQPPSAVQSSEARRPLR